MDDFLLSFLSLDFDLDLPQIGGDLARSKLAATVPVPAPASSSSDESRISWTVVTMD